MSKYNFCVYRQAECNHKEACEFNDHCSAATLDMAIGQYNPAPAPDLWDEAEIGICLNVAPQNQTPIGIIAYLKQHYSLTKKTN